MIKTLEFFANVEKMMRHEPSNVAIADALGVPEFMVRRAVELIDEIAYHNDMEEIYGE